MRATRIDARGWWELLLLTAFCAVLVWLFLGPDSAFGTIPPWVIVAVTVVVAAAMPLSVMFAWRGGRRARQLQVDEWLQAGRVSGNVPLAERLNRLQRRSNQVGLVWFQLLPGVVWVGVLVSDWRDSPVGWPCLIVLWAALAFRAVYRTVRYRKVLARLLAETTDEAKAAGMYSSIL